MREDLRRNLLAQKVVDKEVGEKATPSEADIKAFFDANKAQFNRTEDSVRIAQIVITPVREQQRANRTGDDASSPQEATAKAQMLMQRLKEGIAFGDLAADFSEDPESAQRGGDLGFVPISALAQAPPALRDAVLKSNPGTVQLVSQGGAHTIVLVVAKDKKGQKDLSMPEVKDGISSMLKNRKEQLLRAAYLVRAQERSHRGQRSREADRRRRRQGAGRSRSRYRCCTRQAVVALWAGAPEAARQLTMQFRPARCAETRAAAPAFSCPESSVTALRHRRDRVVPHEAEEVRVQVRRT